MQIEFEGVSYAKQVSLNEPGVQSIGTQASRMLRRGKGTKVILNRCSGVLCPGTMTLVLLPLFIVDFPYEFTFVTISAPGSTWVREDEPDAGEVLKTASVADLPFHSVTLCYCFLEMCRLLRAGLTRTTCRGT